MYRNEAIKLDWDAVDDLQLSILFVFLKVSEICTTAEVFV